MLLLATGDAPLLQCHLLLLLSVVKSVANWPVAIITEEVGWQ